MQGHFEKDNAQIFPATVTFVVNFNIVWLAPLEVLMKADCRWGVPFPKTKDLLQLPFCFFSNEKMFAAE